jgi:hypothetical protein
MRIPSPSPSPQSRRFLRRLTSPGVQTAGKAKPHPPQPQPQPAVQAFPSPPHQPEVQTAGKGQCMPPQPQPQPAVQAFPPPPHQSEVQTAGQGKGEPQGASRANPHPALVALVVLAFLASCAPERNGNGAADRSADATADGAVDGAADADGWIVLFDGSGLDHWRGYRREDVPRGWQVQDGVLAFVPDVEGGDLITRDRYTDFELELDWRVSTGGNSGIFFRASEEHPAIYYGAPEYQILDDDEHSDGLDPLTSSASNYGLHAPTGDALRPAGEWNRARIVVRGPLVEHWLNGERVVAYELGSEDWEARVAASKFVEWPEYGRHSTGHIGLQDHGDPVWFRDIRIRIPPGAPPPDRPAPPGGTDGSP